MGCEQQDTLSRNDVSPDKPQGPPPHNLAFSALKYRHLYDAMGPAAALLP